MSGKSLTVASALLAVLSTAELCPAVTPLKLTGTLSGSVKDTTGIPQMGATVLLFNRYDRLMQKALTNAKGSFAFDNLSPDIYSVRVRLASFVPAVKRNISIQPGMQSVLAINMASVLSSIELVYSAPSSGALMSDDWKWVLRSSMSSRPVIRLLPHEQSTTTAAAFTDTRGIVKLSSGDGGLLSLGGQPDLGTTFALATSLYGRNQIKFTGNIGYNGAETAPATAFRTSFARSDMAGPEVKLTVQQYNLRPRGTTLIGGVNQNAPALRTLSLTTIERIQVGDHIRLDYGASLDSVTFLDRLNYVSPFARLSYDLGGGGSLEFAFSSGAPPVELIVGDSRERDYETGLSSDMAAVGMMPRVSMRDGSARVQRTQNFELGYRVKQGSRTFSIGAYRESVANAALILSGPGDLYDTEDMLPDVSSRSSVFNIGNYTRYGYTVAIAQNLPNEFTVGVAYGRGGVLGSDGRQLQTDEPDELRASIHRGQRHFLTGRVSGVAPITGTRFMTSYEWSDSRSLTPGHVYLTQRLFPEAGLNVRVRQPLPSFAGLPGRLEASAELRNLLAQGYLPVTSRSGQRVVLTHSPRSLRGGLAFIF